MFKKTKTKKNCLLLVLNGGRQTYLALQAGLTVLWARLGLVLVLFPYMLDPALSSAAQGPILHKTCSLGKQE